MSRSWLALGNRFRNLQSTATMKYPWLLASISVHLQAISGSVHSHLNTDGPTLFSAAQEDKLAS